MWWVRSRVSVAERENWRDSRHIGVLARRHLAPAARNQESNIKLQSRKLQQVKQDSALSLVQFKNKTFTRQPEEVPRCDWLHTSLLARPEAKGHRQPSVAVNPGSGRTS